MQRRNNLKITTFLTTCDLYHNIYSILCFCSDVDENGSGSKTGRGGNDVILTHSLKQRLPNITMCGKTS